MTIDIFRHDRAAEAAADRDESVEAALAAAESMGNPQ